MKTLKRLSIIFLVVVAVASAGCRKTRPANQQTAANENVAVTQQDATAGAPSAGERFYFRGTIGANLKIEINLVRDGEVVTGSYFYPKVGKNIELSGTVDKDGNL